MNIAIISPAIGAYSETFIEAHKSRLKGKIFFYYGGPQPQFLDNFGKLVPTKLAFANGLRRKARLTKFTALEEGLFKSLRRNKIDVVLAEYGTTAHEILPVCRKLGIPMVVHFHGYDASMDRIIESCGNYREVFAYASSVIAVSKAMYERLLALGCPENKLVYNVYGPNPDFFAVKPTFGTQRFVGIGRFVDKKAPYYTILAFEKIASEFPNARLVIAGNGPLHATCVNLVKHFGLEGKVSLPGIVKPEEFMKMMESAMAFVQHSITAESGDQEGTPLAVLESGAAGLPVIASRHAGIPDVVIDGQTGLLFDEHDVDAMAACMRKILSEKGLAQTLGQAAKERIRKEFALERHIEKIDELLAKAAE